jgi:integrase
VHRALKQAVRWQLITRNPASDLELPTVPKSEMITLDQDQAARLVAAVEQAPAWLRMLVTLGLALGCRRGELLALRWAEVDLDDSTVRVGRSLRIVGGRLDVKGPKTEAGYRDLALPAFAVTALRRHRVAQAEQRLALGGAYRDEDLVLCRPDGRPVRPDYASAAFRTLIRRAHLPHEIHVHTLRHSAASFLAAAGVPASDIAAQLGHKDGGSLALRVYVHPMAEGLRRAGAVLAGIIGRAPNAR